MYLFQYFAGMEITFGKSAVYLVYKNSLFESILKKTPISSLFYIKTIIISLFLAYYIPLYALFRAYRAFLGFPRPFRGTLGPFKTYSRLSEKITLFDENYICIPIKNSNPEDCILEKKLIFEEEKKG